MSTKTKKEYDKRTHDERIHDLKVAFAELKIEANAANKKTLASASNVLAKAGVNRTYFFKKGGKLKDKEEQRKYDDVKDAIKKWQDNFENNVKTDGPLQKAQALAKKESERAIKMEGLLEQSRAQVVEMRNKIKQSQDKIYRIERDLVDSTYSTVMHKQVARGNIEGFSSAKVVSPDIYLMREGEYQFNNEKLRNDAWNLCSRELTKLLERDLPLRIYMLIGAPCSGKTTWSSNENFLASDRHPIVIDATNLTQIDRMHWMMIINQFVRTGNIKTRAVVFDTPTTVLISRNNQRELSKKMKEQTILDKAQKLEWPDLRKEKFDEMEVVRYAED